MFGGPGVVGFVANVASKSMKIVLSLAMLLVLLEGIALRRIWRQNQTLRASSAQIEQVRSDLARALETASANDGEVQSLKDNVARLGEELEHAKAAVVPATLVQVQKTPPLEAHDEFQPVGLTTNDVDLTSMLVSGTDSIGVLFVPLVGRALEKIREIHNKGQPLVFGKLISKGDFAVWGNHQQGQSGGTNIGMSLHFHSKGEAEAVAAEMRAQGTQ